MHGKRKLIGVSAILVLAFSAWASADTSFDGGLTGSADIILSVGSQSAQSVTATIDGSWRMAAAGSSGMVISVSGQIAGDGFSGRFDWGLDENGTASGSWRVPGCDGMGGELTIGLSDLSVRFSGTYPAANVGSDGRTVSGFGTLSAQGQPLQRIGGPVAGPIAGNGPFSLTTALLPVSGQASFAGICSGQWSVDIYADNTFSGRTECAFSGNALMAVPLLGSYTVPIVGSITGNFDMSLGQELAFRGDCSFQTALTSDSVENVSSTTGFSFAVPITPDGKLIMNGEIPLAGKAAVAGVGSATYDLAATFALSLFQSTEGLAASGLASGAATVAPASEGCWIITGTLSLPSDIDLHDAPITIAAHGGVTGSLLNPADQSMIYAVTTLVRPGAFTLSIPSEVERVYLFLSGDCNRNGVSDAGDLGGHYTGGVTDGAPVPVERPTDGSTATADAFTAGLISPVLSGAIVLSAQMLQDAMDNNTPLIVQLQDAHGVAIDTMPVALERLDFNIIISPSHVGQTVTVLAFLDANGNHAPDEGEHAGQEALPVNESNTPIYIALQ